MNLSPRSIFEFSIGLAIIAACGSIVYNNVREPSGRPSPAKPPARKLAPLPRTPIPLTGAHVEGGSTARVGILQYSDFQCPFCGKFARETLPALRTTLLATGKVLMAFKHLPLDAIHPLATLAAKFADCAGKHGQFWSAHDALFRTPFDASADALRRIWKDSGLSGDSLAPCLATSNLEQIAANSVEARKLDVTGTPTFFLGYVEADNQLRVTDRLIGAVKPSQITEVVDRLLASK